MTDSDIRKRFVELAPKAWDCSTSSNIVDLTFEIEGRTYILGSDGSGFGARRAEAALALLKHLGFEYTIRTAIQEPSGWECYYHPTERDGTVDYWHHSEPIYAVLQAVNEKLERENQR